MAGRSVSEICGSYVALDASRAALDHQIQAAQSRAATSRTLPPQTDDPGATPGETEGAQSLHSIDMWTELDAVLRQQSNVLTTLAETRSVTIGHIRAKSQVLQTLLQPSRDNPEESGLARLLTLSLIRDIEILLT